MTEETLIVADIGGTNARFAIADLRTKELSRLASYKTNGFRDLEGALGAYLITLDETAPRQIAIGAAGPFASGKIHLTNIDWTIDPASLSHAFGLDTKVLTNDLVALAAGIAQAPQAAFLALGDPQVRGAFRTLVISVGTGLGVAWCERRDQAVMVHPTEAGHMTFAPVDDTGFRLVSDAARYGRTLSFESLISGAGIKFVYSELRGLGPAFENSEAIFLAAESGGNQAARDALALVTSSLATFAQDLMHALGGVDEIIFAGGLGRRLRRQLQSEKFLKELRAARGGTLDFSEVGARLALDDRLPLFGALHLALGTVEFDHPRMTDPK